MGFCSRPVLRIDTLNSHLALTTTLLHITKVLSVAERFLCLFPFTLMMRVFIVHRWAGTPRSDWYPWLQQKLVKMGIAVVVPKMPNTDEPKIKAWVTKLQEAVGKPDEQTYFVGHSIGCQTILRYLAALPVKSRVGGIVLVAGWFTLQNLEDKEMEAIATPWLTAPIDFVKVSEKTKKIVVMLSDNDSYVNLKENRALFQKNLSAKIIVVKGPGHFTADEGITSVPEVLREIQTLSGEANQNEHCQ